MRRPLTEFDLNRFADMVEATGAGYVILTIGHAQTYCPAPLASWEKYHPGMTTQRDLIAGMADALQAKGIKLMCYLNVAGLGNYSAHQQRGVQPDHDRCPDGVWGTIQGKSGRLLV